MFEIWKVGEVDPMQQLQRNVAGQLLCLALGGEADAHDWYSNKKDPVLHLKCCGDPDCRPVHPDHVRPTKDGGYFVMRPFSYWSDPPAREWFVPKERVQEAPDDQYHICEAVVPTKRGPSDIATEYRLGWTCFFAPRGTSSIAP